MSGNYDYIANSAVKSLNDSASEVAMTRQAAKEVLATEIKSFFTDLDNQETELINLVNKNRRTNLLDNSLMEQYSQQRQGTVLNTFSRSLRKKIRKKNTEEIMNKLADLFRYGYQLAMLLRSYFSESQEINYEIASEKRNWTFKTDENILLKHSKITIDSLKFSLDKGKISINYVMRLSNSVAFKEESEEKFGKESTVANLNSGDGSTFWSRGISILKILQEQFEEITGGTKGLNFGHFIEAYYYFNGNDINFEREKQPDGFSYGMVMMGLRNNAAFYTGGDINNIQLKANQATITSLSAIKKILKEILNLLENSNITEEEREKQIKEKFTKSGAEKGIEEMIEEQKEKISEGKFDHMQKILIKF